MYTHICMYRSRMMHIGLQTHVRCSASERGSIQALVCLRQALKLHMQEHCETTRELDVSVGRRGHLRLRARDVSPHVRRRTGAQA